MGTTLDAQESTIKTEFNSGLERITFCSVRSILIDGSEPVSHQYLLCVLL